MGIIKKAKAATVDPNANYDSKIIQVSTENDDEDWWMEKTDSITKSLSRPYFNRIPNGLAKANPNNGKAIHDYIFAGRRTSQQKRPARHISGCLSVIGNCQ
jgi:hypothetical protein